MSRFNPITFYRELRRRRVFRVAVLYGVGAWGVIAACDVIFPQLIGWVADPDRAMRAVFIAAIALFPIALVFGWLYDITAEGIRRTADFSASAHDPDTSLHPVDRGIIGGLGALMLAAVIATTVHIVRMEAPVILAGSQAGPAIPENSIAVLPFESCKGPGVDPLLAVGIANEVLTHLAEIPNLKVTAKQLIVIARASAFAFAETDAEPQRIASTLRVRYLLSGTVCRDGDALTVTAELVDESGYLVWSHRYTEQLDAAGQVTRSVAALLAEGVASRLGAVMPVPQDEPVNRLAYEQLLIGREYGRRSAGAEQKARAAFESALELKPDYAEAVFALATLELPTFNNPNQAEALEKFRLLAERALAMARHEMQRNPASARAYFVAGRITRNLLYVDKELSWRRGEPPRTEDWNRRRAEAERLMRRSIELNPSESNAHFYLFLTLEEQGRDHEALSVLEQALDRDPFNPRINWYVALRWAELGRTDDARELLARFKSLPEVPSIVWYELFQLAGKRGRFDEYCELLVELRRENPAEALGQPYFYWDFVGFLGDLGLKKEAAAWKKRLQHLPLPWWMHFRAETTQDEFRAWYERASALTDEEIIAGFAPIAVGMAEAIARSGGDYDRAIRLLERLRYAEVGDARRQGQPEAEIFLASLYQKVGRRADAKGLLAKLEGELEAKVKGGVRLSATLDYLAKVYALRGESEAALSTLEMSAAAGNRLVTSCMHDLIANPIMPGNFTTIDDALRSLRGERRFQVLDERCRAEEAEQVARIQAMLGEHDLDELLEPFINMTDEQLKELDEQLSRMW